MSWLSEAYKKSGLRNIYEKNKSTILNTGAIGGLMLATGGLGGLGIPALTTTQALGATAAAGLLGASKDKARLSDLANARRLEILNKEKESAGNRVNDTLKGIVGDPNSPVVNTDPNNLMVSEPPLNPVTGVPDKSGLIDAVVGDTPMYGGAADTGGQASRDQEQLINEAELAYKLQNEQAGKSKAERAQMLKDYADLITSQQNRILNENSPALYEDLNTRGLLRSSELGNAMARERAKAASVLQEQVGLQGLNDREAYLKSIEDANTNYIQGRSGGIQRRFSLEDFARQAQVAKDTGIALQPISTGTPSSKAGDAAMIGAGANVISAFKGKGGVGPTSIAATRG